MKYAIIFALVGVQAIAQQPLVEFNDLHYVSGLEHKLISKYHIKQGSDRLGILLSLNPSATEQSVEQIRQRLQKTVEELLASRWSKKKPNKKIQAVYTTVHDTYLKKYETENRFHEIFQTGNYNCVTATALYALILDQLDIPYSIKEEPTHVYLVAYPNTQNIMIESTTPLFGYVNYDPKFKTDFVGNLKNQKLIGQAEAQSKSVDQLFNEYFFRNESIDLNKLVGIHYMNDALFRNEHGDRINAFRQAEKAYLFYPSQRCQYMLTVFCAQILSQEKLSPTERAVYIGKISRYHEQGVTHDMIEGEFFSLTGDVLGRDNNKSLYTACYEAMMAKVRDSTLADKLTFTYHYEMGRTYYNEGKFVQAYPNFQLALGLQPNNVDLGRTFVQCLTQTFRFDESNKAVIDTLEQISHDFPSLRELDHFNSLVGDAYLLEMLYCFDSRKPIAAESYRKRFENHMLNYKNFSINHDLVGRAYSEGCAYYFKNGQKAKAREILNKGLAYAPENYELRVRQQMLNR